MDGKFTHHPHERFGHGAVVLGGIAALVFGFMYIGQSIFNPLKLKPRTFVTTEEHDAQLKAELKTKDTDHDGLTDYAETYLYGTSPYLVDTDSDGYNDSIEIDSGNDPLCPRGKACRGTVIGTTPLLNPSATESKQGSPNDFISPSNLNALFSAGGSSATSTNATATSSPTATPEEIQSLIQNLTPADIRGLLLNDGVPQETLDKLDDKTLMKMFTDTVLSTKKP